MNKHLLVQLGYDYLNSGVGMVHFVENEEDNKFFAGNYHDSIIYRFLRR